MNIALLCRNLHTAGGRVVGINFIRSLKSINRSHRYLVIAPTHAGYDDIELPQESELFIYKGGTNPFKQWKFDAIDVFSTLKRFRPDIVFAMGNIGLTSPPCPQAILFHKPQLIYPERHYASERRVARIKNNIIKKRLKSCLKMTDLVFCQTDVARERFHREFGFSFDQIRIMPNAVSGFIQASRQEAGIPNVFEEKSFFNLFFLTKFYAHKNLEVLLDLFKKHRDALRDVRCITTVKEDQHPNARKFLRAIRDCGLEKQVVNVGPLEQRELAGYFYHSDALLFPSLLESFSGTYLEAMHFGLPILTSDLDFARYICGEAALYFDPWDSGDIAGTIVKLKNDKELQRRLVETGKERMTRFFKNWEEITAEVISELESLALRANAKNRLN